MSKPSVFSTVFTSTYLCIAGPIARGGEGRRVLVLHVRVLLGVVLLIVLLADLRVHVGELEAGRDQEWELRGLGARLRTGPLEEAVKQRHADVHGEARELEGAAELEQPVDALRSRAPAWQRAALEVRVQLLGAHLLQRRPE